MRGTWFDHAAMLAIGLELRPDPLTGHIEPSDLMHYIVTHMEDNPDVQRMMSAAINSLPKIGEERKRVRETVDFSSLPVEPTGLWVVQMWFDGLQTADGRPVEGRSPAGSSREHLQQMFRLTCSLRIGPGMEVGIPWHEDTFVGLPTSKQVEDFLCQAMAAAMPGYEAYIPKLLILTSKLKQHETSLRSFLDSLPTPFEWCFADKNMEDSAAELSYFRHQQQYEYYLGLATKKEGGNKAFATKNHGAAIDAYMEALRFAGKARVKADTDELTSRIDNLGAICYANCSAARLLEGNTKDAQKALKDAKHALEYDRYYAKGYARLSRAYEALGDRSRAEESIVKALRLPQLENHEGLVDHLIMLQTNGEGLPNNHDTFLEWLKEVFVDGESAERMKDVGGLWRQRCEGHRKKFEVA